MARIKMNRNIEDKLASALKNVGAITVHNSRTLDPALWVEADALRLYVQTWIEAPLQQALNEIRGATVEDWDWQN